MLLETERDKRKEQGTPSDIHGKLAFSLRVSITACTEIAAPCKGEKRVEKGGERGEGGEQRQKVGKGESWWQNAGLFACCYRATYAGHSMNQPMYDSRDRTQGDAKQVGEREVGKTTEPPFSVSRAHDRGGVCVQSAS